MHKAKNKKIQKIDKMENQFELKSGKKGVINLQKKTKSNIITITKVQFNKTEIDHPVHPIRIYTEYPNGATLSDFLNPIAYFGPCATNNITDTPINLTINDCKYTTVELVVPSDLEDKISYNIYYNSINEPALIDIEVVEQAGGYLFYLPSKSLDQIKRIFPSSRPVNSLFIAYETLKDFQLYRGSIFNIVPLTLFGITDSEIKMINIRVINANNGKIIFSTKNPHW